MARTFNGTTDYLNTTIGACAALSGDLSIAMVTRASTDGVSGLGFGIGGANRWSIGKDSTNVIRWGNAATAVKGTTAWTVSSGWVFVAATKPAGSSTGRVHLYVYQTRTWVHENAVGVAMPDAVPDAGANFGARAGPGSFYGGDIAVGGAWAANLTDAQVEALAFRLHSWWLPSTKGIWVLDQAATGTKVWDLTGNGANESTITGTSVASSAVAVWNRGAPIITVHAANPFSTVSGSAAITGTGTISASGVRKRFGAATITGSGTVSATGVRKRFATAAVSGTGAVSASGTVTRSGSAAITGTGTITIAGVRTVLAAAALSGAGAIVAAGARGAAGSAAIVGTGTISATGTTTLPYPYVAAIHVSIAYGETQSFTVETEDDEVDVEVSHTNPVPTITSIDENPIVVLTVS